jgi:large subunit ribosomal protein L9e
MRLVYAHFPINANAEKGGSELSIRNFLGEKIVRQIPMCEGVKVIKDTDVKDQLLFEGNSIENVSRYDRTCVSRSRDVVSAASHRGSTTYEHVCAAC